MDEGMRILSKSNYLQIVAFNIFWYTFQILAQPR